MNSMIIFFAGVVLGAVVTFLIMHELGEEGKVE